jgi:hypothetical protein
MRRRSRQYLLKADWPKVDQALLNTACKLGTDPFDDCGPAAHLAQRTQSQLEYTYGKYLLFVSDRHPEMLKRPPSERINRNTIADYIKWQPTSCGGVTLGNYIYHLWMILRYICPDENWSWLLTISKRISA